MLSFQEMPSPNAPMRPLPSRFRAVQIISIAAPGSRRPTCWPQLHRSRDALSLCLVTRQAQLQMLLCIGPFTDQHTVHDGIANTSVAARVMVP